MFWCEIQTQSIEEIEEENIDLIVNFILFFFSDFIEFGINLIWTRKNYATCILWNL